MSFPIRIMATPHLEPAKEEWRIPSNWAPYAPNSDPAYIYLQNPDEKSEYMIKYVDNYWNKWKKNVEPIIADAEKERTAIRRKTVKMCESDPDETPNED